MQAILKFLFDLFILPFLKRQTTDAVLSNLNKSVNKLEKVAVSHDKKADKLKTAAETILKTAVAASSEAERAKRVRDRLGKLLS